MSAGVCEVKTLKLVGAGAGAGAGAGGGGAGTGAATLPIVTVNPTGKDAGTTTVRSVVPLHVFVVPASVGVAT